MTDEQNAARHKLDLAMDSLKRFDHYIATTNFKVGLLSSFLAAGLALTFAPPASGENPCSGWLAFAQLLVAVTAITSAYFLLQAVFPRLRSGQSRSRFFFNDLANWPGKAAGFSADFKSASIPALLDDMLEQSFWVAGVASQKFSAIQKATRVVQCMFLPALMVALGLRIIGGL